MRDPVGGGSRPPPKPRLDGGAGIQPASGDWRMSSGELKGSSWGSGETKSVDPSSAYEEKPLHVTMSDHMEEGEATPNAGSASYDSAVRHRRVLGGAGLGLASGDQVVVSGGLEDEIRSPGAVLMSVSSPACEGNIFLSNSGDVLQLPSDARGVLCESGKDTTSSVFLGGNAQVEIPMLDTRNLYIAQTDDDTCMVSHNVQVNDEDACMVSGDGQVNVSDACLVFDAGVSVSSSLLSPSADFCMGAVDGFGSCLPNSSAQLSRPQGVCDNVSSKSGQSVKDFGGVFGSSRPCDNMTQAWKKPVLVPLLPVADLGEFSLDGTTAILDDEEVNVTLKRFNHSIVGRMFGRRIPFHLLTSELSRKWGAFGRFRLITLSGDCFVCTFDSMEACEAILVGGPWVILGQILGIERWSPTFSSSSMDGFRTPVWIRMPNLPLYCWGSKNIARITALIGEPLWIDAATKQIDKGVFARACVRIDLSKPLRPGVWVQGRHGRFFQRLEYEGLSVFCFRCCQVGHKAIACKVLPSFFKQNAVDSLPPKHHGAVSVQELPCKSSSVLNSSALDGKDNHHSSRKVIQTVEQLSVDCDAGPWMMVQRKRRPSKGNQQNNQVLNSVHGALNSKASAYIKDINKDVFHPIFSAGTGTNISPPQCNSVLNNVSSAAVRKPRDVIKSPSGAVNFCSPNTLSMNMNVQLQDSSLQESRGTKVKEPRPRMSVQNSNKFALLSSPEVSSNVVTVQPGVVMKGISNNRELQVGNGVNNSSLEMNKSISIDHSLDKVHVLLDMDCSNALVPYDNNVKEFSSTKERMSKSYADRMTNGLGPLVHGDRNKKRKKEDDNGGGDASSQKLP